MLCEETISRRDGEEWPVLTLECVERRFLGELACQSGGLAGGRDTEAPTELPGERDVALQRGGSTLMPGEQQEVELVGIFVGWISVGGLLDEPNRGAMITDARKQYGAQREGGSPDAVELIAPAEEPAGGGVSFEERPPVEPQRLVQVGRCLLDLSECGGARSCRGEPIERVDVGGDRSVFGHQVAGGLANDEAGGTTVCERGLERASQVMDEHAKRVMCAEWDVVRPDRSDQGFVADAVSLLHEQQLEERERLGTPDIDRYARVEADVEAAECAELDLPSRRSAGGALLNQGDEGKLVVSHDGGEPCDHGATTTTAQGHVEPRCSSLELIVSGTGSSAGACGQRARTDIDALPPWQIRQRNSGEISQLSVRIRQLK